MQRCNQYQRLKTILSMCLPITWDCLTCAMTWKGSVDENTICSHCSDFSIILKQEVVGDYVTDLENGRTSYVPYLYDDFDDLSKEPIYCKISFTGIGDKTIFYFPIWVLFEDKK